MEKRIDELLPHGFIRPGICPCGSLFLFTKKNDGSLGMCREKRASRKRTLKNEVPLPRIDEVCDQE